MYKIIDMKKEHIDEIGNWKYEKPYDFYSFDGVNDALYKEFLDGTAFAVLDEDKNLFGYFCFGKSAQVPNDTYGYNEPEFVDIGLGMNPNNCGKGKGLGFMNVGLEFAKEKYGTEKFRLSVANFNKRAIKLYENLGFEKIISFDRTFTSGVTTFDVMLKK